MNKTTRGTGFYLLLGLLCVFLIFTLRDSFNGRSDITERQLADMLEKGTVSRVDVIQNEEVPTGSLQVTTTENEVLTVNVTDVSAAVEKLDRYDGDSKAEKAKKWLMTKGIEESTLERIRKIFIKREPCR